MKKGFRILKFKKDKPVFEVKDVSKSFDGRPILKKLSLKVYPGECVGVLGPNGCGKTTLFSMCIGEENVENGKIFLNGNSIETLWSALGGGNAMVTRNGDPTYANSIYYNGTTFHRFYFGSWSNRPGQTPHSGFLSHGHIGQLHLGSWSPRTMLLIIKD